MGSKIEYMSCLFLRNAVLSRVKTLHHRVFKYQTNKYKITINTKFALESDR